MASWLVGRVLAGNLYFFTSCFARLQRGPSPRVLYLLTTGDDASHHDPLHEVVESEEPLNNFLRAPVMKK